MNKDKQTNPVGRPLKFKTPKELQAKIDEYYIWAEKKKKPLTIGRLCVFLDVERHHLWRIAKEKSKFSTTIKKTLRYILASKEERLNTQGTVAGIIFDLKNNNADIYRDKQELEHTLKDYLHPELKDIPNDVLKEILSKIEKNKENE